MGRLEGRVAIVTGGANGIGKVYCSALAAEGAAVVVADITGSDEAAAALEKAHGQGRAHAFAFDVSDETQVKSVVDGAIARCGKIDVLVNNAAIFSTLKPTEPEDIDVALWDRVMAVNVRGPFLMAKHVVPHMKKAGYGKIINIASGTAYRGIPHMAHYVTSKGAMLGFTRALARDLGKHGIRVNTLAPGMFPHEDMAAHMTANRPEGYGEAGRTIPAGRVGRLHELGWAATYLCSPFAAYVSGHTFVIDGANWQRRGLKMPAVVPIREQLPKRPPR